MRFPCRLVAALVCAATALRAGPPFLTGDPDIVDHKRLEFIPGWTSESRPGERVTELPTFEFNYGLAPNVELSYEAAWLSVREDGAPRVSGYSNSIVGLKWRFLEAEKDGIAVALKPEFEFRNPGSSSVHKGLAEDENAFELQLRAEKEVGGFALGAAVGRAFPSKSDGAWVFGAIVKKEVIKGCKLGLELHGEAASSFSRSAVLLNAGAKFEVSEHAEFLVGIGRELHNHDEPRVTLRTYLGWQQTF